MSERIERVRVTNRNAFLLSDMHDGVPYEFPPGVTVTIPVEAAAHMFGWPAEEQEMHLYMARRYGWNQPHHYKADDNGLMLWQKNTRNIILSVEQYEMRRVQMPNAPIPAEEAAEAPDVIGLNIDPPAPRRTVVGRRKRGTGKPRKQVLRPRVPQSPPSSTSEPVSFETPSD